MCGDFLISATEMVEVSLATNLRQLEADNYVDKELLRFAIPLYVHCTTLDLSVKWDNS